MKGDFRKRKRDGAIEITEGAREKETKGVREGARRKCKEIMNENDTGSERESEGARKGGIEREEETWWERKGAKAKGREIKGGRALQRETGRE